MFLNIFIIIYSFVLCIILFFRKDFLPLDFDTAIEITKLFHNNIWNSYHHHQWVIPYLNFNFWIFSFIKEEYTGFILIFFLHYFFSLLLIWKIITYYSKNKFINLLYFISLSISGFLVFILFTFEDSLLTLPYYLLSFYFFIQYYDTKNIKLLIISSILSGFSVSINSSDFFLVIGVSFFFIYSIFESLIKKEKELYLNVKHFFYYGISFWIVLITLLLIKSLSGKDTLYFLLYETFVNPQTLYTNVMGKFGITLERIIKTFNMFSYFVIQGTKFLVQFHFHIAIYDLILISIIIFVLWNLRSYKPLIVILIILLINIYILITSDEIAINERLLSSIFLFLLFVKIEEKWPSILFGLLFLYSFTNLKHHRLQKETMDTIIEISKKEKVYLTVYYFYDEKSIQNYIQNKIPYKDILAYSTGSTMGLSQLLIKNECYIYNPYGISLPYLPKNCKVFSDIIYINISANKNLSNVYIDPYLIDLIENKKWNCKDFKEYLHTCNAILSNYQSTKKNFFPDSMIEHACNLFFIPCVQKVQFSCNFSYYCQFDYLQK